VTGYWLARPYDNVGGIGLFCVLSPGSKKFDGSHIPIPKIWIPNEGR
jgi:hypothetical protein